MSHISQFREEENREAENDADFNVSRALNGDKAKIARAQFYKALSTPSNVNATPANRSKDSPCNETRHV